MIVDLVCMRVDEVGVELMGLQAHRDVSNLPRGTSEAVIVLETDTLTSIVGRVKNTCRSLGQKMRLLRIHSHGQPGSLLGGRLTSETVRNQASVIRSLRGSFQPEAHIYLHSCRVAAGDSSLLISLARLTNTLVTASTSDQYVGAGATFYFVGTTLTAEPVNGRINFNLHGIPRGPNPHSQP